MADLIRVMLVDDHAMVRDGLKVFLMMEDDIDVVGEAGNGSQAIEQCAALQPHVILMDMMMPVMDGPTATKEIKAQFPSVQIVALTSFQQDDSLVQKAVQAGAIGFVYKDIDPDDLVKTIRAAHAGQPAMAPAATQALMKAATKTPDPEFDLTKREIEVLTLMTEGMTNQEIAAQLTVSNSTVGYHVGNILSKLGISNRTEAASVAHKYNLIPKS